MRDRTWKEKAGAAIILCVLALAAITLFEGSDGRAQAPRARAVKPPPAPVWVVDTPGLMVLFNKPLYAQLKADMAAKPASEGAWASIEARGLQAAELANLVAIRPAQPPKEQWGQLSVNLQQAGIALAKAAKAKDWDGTTRAYQGLIQKCNDCHQTRAQGKAPKLTP